MNRSNNRTAYVNISLIVINVIVYFVLEAIGNTESGSFMLAHGAVFLPNIIYGHEYYRLLTAVFLHFGISHLVNNIIVLFVLGDNLERALGHVKYLIFYLLCGIGANICSVFVELQQNTTAVSAGASGAIFGVIGGLLYAVLVNKGRLEDLSTRQLGVMILLSLYHGFTSTGVNNVAHVSGLCIGVLLAVVMYRKPKPRSERLWYM